MTMAVRYDARTGRGWPAVLALLCLVAVMPSAVRADAPAAPFDLTGPTLDVTVTRAKLSRPITEVPFLVAGDRLEIRAELPASQSTHYLLVAAFLRGATNPPPKDWFHRCDTWTRACQERGLSIVVPADAAQILLFFAPETGGDFHTLVEAVRGRPGAFVRASQELNQAALDRLRLEQYLAGVHEVQANDPQKLKDAAPLLARSLAIKVNEKCLERVPALQAACLTDGRDVLILDDGHGKSMVATLTSGPASDLALQVGSTPMLAGSYSPYIGSVLDIARLLDTFHTARYQYIPALAAHRGARVALLLNTPPSFHDPQSVLVAALPAIEAAPPPALRAVDPKKAYCPRQSPLLLPVDGAPLVFATGYAHDMVLRVMAANGGPLDLPAHADALDGGYLVDTALLAQHGGEAPGRATLRGQWGFDAYEGPAFVLAGPSPKAWQLASGDAAALVVGREDTVRLESGSAACLESVRLRDATGVETPLSWKAVREDQVELKVPLERAEPGAVTLIVRQYGTPEPQRVELATYADPGRLDGFVLHAGDAQGELRGTRLDQVARLALRGVEFLPATLASSNGRDTLEVRATDAAAAAALNSGEAARAKVTLRDGRTLNLEVTVAAGRPRLALIAKHVEPATGNGVPITLGLDDELPLDSRLTFSLRAEAPATFARDEQIDVATEDESLATRLTIANRGLVLQSAKVAVATLEPRSAFGASAYGLLKFRRVAGGVTGAWQPLATLVRLPVLTGLTCGPDAQATCELAGSDLYLLQAVAADEAFSAPVEVPDGYPGLALTVPHAAAGRLYLRLRDDPAAINVVAIGAAP